MVATNKIKNLNIADIAFWLFVASTVTLPVGFGGNRAIPFGIAQAGLAVTCLLLFFGRAHWNPPRIFPRLRFALVLFAAVLTWGLIQTLPVVPESWAHPLWKEASDVIGHHLPGTISISPEDSLVGLGRLLTYIAIGLIAYALTQEPKRARQLVTALWIAGTVICTYGLAEYIAGAGKILWFKKWAYETDLTATFVNRNHFAVYCGMVMVTGAALLVQSFRENVLGQKQQLRSQLARDWLIQQGAVRFFSLVLLVFCIALSHSRSGLVLSMGGLGSYFFFYQVYRKQFGRALITALAAFIILVLVFMTALEFSDRFPSLFVDYSSRDRLQVYELSINALRDNPWLGYGLDGFQPVFRLYQRGMVMEFVHAHSDILESLLDLGIPAGLTLWLAIITAVSGLARGIARRRRHGLYPCLALGCTIIVFGHCMIDFSMQIPGDVGTWALLLGCGLAQSWRQEEKQPAQEWSAY